MRGAPVHPIVIAAGGTGGHVFPAEALAQELVRRGARIVLMTDGRSGALKSDVFQGRETFVLPGAGIAGRGVLRGAQAAIALATGTVRARALLARLQPACVVGFGGYPSVAPVAAARLLRNRPRIMLHEQNGVLGRANRALSRHVDLLALGLPRTLGIPDGVPTRLTGNPVRAAILAHAAQPYAPPEADGPIRLLVTGGSLGARIFSDAVPAAAALLPEPLRTRLRIIQQCRAEDLDRVRAAWAALGVPAELATFFPDIAARLADAHYVIARAGASTVAELTVIGRPALLVPLPGAIDGHQAANAAAIDADRLDQAEFAGAPAVLAERLAERLASPATLVHLARRMADHGRPDAAATLADAVMQDRTDAPPPQTTTQTMTGITQ